MAYKIELQSPSHTQRFLQSIVTFNLKETASLQQIYAALSAGKEIEILNFEIRDFIKEESATLLAEAPLYIYMNKAEDYSSALLKML